MDLQGPKNHYQERVLAAETILGPHFSKHQLNRRQYTADQPL